MGTKISYTVVFMICNLMSCVNISYTDTYPRLTQDITLVLKDWGFKTEVNNVVENANLRLEIKFKLIKNDTSKSYFLDEASNTIIIENLIADSYTKLDTFQSVQIELLFEGFEGEKLNYNFSSVDIQEIHKKTSAVFITLAASVFRNFRYEGVVALDGLVKLGTKRLNYFNYNDSFLKLLSDFCKYCDNKETNLCEAFHFLVFTHIFSDTDNELLSEENKRLLKEIPHNNKCDLPSFSTIEEIYSYINSFSNTDILATCTK